MPYFLRNRILIIYSSPDKTVTFVRLYRVNEHSQQMFCVAHAEMFNAAQCPQVPETELSMLWVALRITDKQVHESGIQSLYKP